MRKIVLAAGALALASLTAATSADAQDLRTIRYGFGQDQGGTGGAQDQSGLGYHNAIGPNLGGEVASRSCSSRTPVLSRIRSRLSHLIEATARPLPSISRHCNLRPTLRPPR